MHKQSEKAEQRKMKCVGRLRNELDIMGLPPFEETAIVDDLACRNLQRQAKLGMNLYNKK